MTRTDPTPRLPQPRAGIAEIPRLPATAFVPTPEGAITLNSNENRFGASPAVAAAIARDLAEEALHLYPAIEAMPLNRALAELHGLDPACVVSAGGGELLLPLALTAFTGPGDEVIRFDDGFFKFRGYILGAGATPVAVPRAGDAVAALLAAVTPRTRAVLIDNPGNPTGQILPPAEIARLQAGLPSDVLLMLDEAYVEFSDWPRLGLGHVPGAGNVMVFRTLSKAYGLAGLRVGWAAGPVPLIEAVKRLVPTFPLPRPTLAGALAALADTDHLARGIAAVRAGRETATRRLRSAGWEVPDSQGNFVLLRDGVAGTHALDAAESLGARGILVRLMPDFLGRPAMRITIGIEAEMEMVFDTLGA